MHHTSSTRYCTSLSVHISRPRPLWVRLWKPHLSKIHHVIMKNIYFSGFFSQSFTHIYLISQTQSHPESCPREAHSPANALPSGARRARTTRCPSNCGKESRVTRAGDEES